MTRPISRPGVEPTARFQRALARRFPSRPADATSAASAPAETPAKAGPTPVAHSRVVQRVARRLSHREQRAAPERRTIAPPQMDLRFGQVGIWLPETVLILREEMPHAEMERFFRFHLRSPAFRGLTVRIAESPWLFVVVQQPLHTRDHALLDQQSSEVQALVQQVERYGLSTVGNTERSPGR